MFRHIHRIALVALSLAGSATLLFSCEQQAEDDAADLDETMMTEYSENLTVLMSQNGQKSYHFTTPLLEGYSLAKEPYREFRKGVKIITYQDDSTTTVDAILTANYAIYFETRQLWEAKGNVVVTKSDGKTLYTEQLFWNARTNKIYSNVDSRIIQKNGADDFVGEGFESDQEFKDWRFRRMTGRMEVTLRTTDDADSTNVDAAPIAPPATDTPKQTEQPRPVTTPEKVRQPMLIQQRQDPSLRERRTEPTRAKQ
ncbi:MAG: LPS export ABC transporter periplasmic protein LptC [Alistipes sp.]